MTIYLGADLSINGPGVTIIDGDKLICGSVRKLNQKVPREAKSDNISIKLIDYPPWLDQNERFHKVVNCLLAAVDFHNQYADKDVKVLYESVSFGSKGRIVDLAMFNQCFISTLHIKYNITSFDKIAPPSVKKQFAGNGRAEKNDMHFAVLNKYGLDISAMLGGVSPDKSPVSDIVDSIAIATILKERFE
jgi:hypothetical protein